MIKPLFFDSFICKADKCTDTCCAGWEIEIDDCSMNKYMAVKSDFGDRIKNSIEYIDSQPCFKRHKDDKCFFLDKNGLCDIYSNLGQSYLCDICREHPRFYDEYDDVVEAGLGLCCEKVCEMLLENDFEIIYDIDADTLEEDISLLLLCRQQIFDILNDSVKPFEKRISECLEYSKKMQNELFDIECDDFIFDKTSFFEFILDLYEKTEPINDKWTKLINELKSNMDIIIQTSEQYDCDSEMYAKIMSYIIYRHFMQVRFSGEIQSVVRMSLMAVTFMYICECYSFYENNEVTYDDKINIIKLWSRQMEYSAENTNYCLTITQ